MHEGHRHISARARARSGMTLAATVLLVTIAMVVAVSNPGSSAESAAPVESQLERGQAVYAFSCTTCHGATGQGFDEARAAFPADHYDCTRCHGPLNPPVMSVEMIAQTQTVFSLGNAPALADGEALSKYGSAAGLYAYVRATMPRWDPGRLDDDAYLDVTAFVLHLAGLLPEGAPELTHEGLVAFDLAAAAD